MKREKGYNNNNNQVVVGGNSNIFSIHPEKNAEMIHFDEYFSDGLKPNN